MGAGALGCHPAPYRNLPQGLRSARSAWRCLVFGALRLDQGESVATPKGFALVE